MASGLLELILLIRASELILRQRVTAALEGLGSRLLNHLGLFCLLLLTDHVEGHRLFTTLVLEKCESITRATPLKVSHLLARKLSNGLGCETLNGILNHLIDINTVSLCIECVILLASIQLSLC